MLAIWPPRLPSATGTAADGPVRATERAPTQRCPPSPPGFRRGAPNPHRPAQTVMRNLGSHGLGIAPLPPRGAASPHGTARKRVTMRRRPARAAGGVVVAGSPTPPYLIVPIKINTAQLAETAFRRSPCNSRLPDDAWRRGPPDGHRILRRPTQGGAPIRRGACAGRPEGHRRGPARRRDSGGRRP